MWPPIEPFNCSPFIWKIEEKQEMPMWKRVETEPEDDKSYFVCYMQADGKYSEPHRAYYIQEENKFFSHENNNSYPIVVDIYFEFPEIPNDFS